jgi:two-component system, LytTR family, response regulator
MSKIKTIIIEDEEPARGLLKNYLSGFDEIELCGEFSDGFSGLKAINEMKPDLVLLDIQMPKLTGFEILELTEHHPVLIFTTAYDQFAIKAFEANAADYLLKPFTLERFKLAIGKAIQRFYNKGNNEEQINSVLRSVDEKPQTIDRIAVRTGKKIHVIASGEIIFLEADGDYVRIHTGTGNYLKEKTMKYFENHLDQKQFIRVHRSYIANISFIERLEYYDKENYAAILKNKNSLKVSSSGYKLLRTALNLD